MVVDDITVVVVFLKNKAAKRSQVRTKFEGTPQPL